MKELKTDLSTWYLRATFFAVVIAVLMAYVNNCAIKALARNARTTPIVLPAPMQEDNQQADWRIHYF